jgi:hypothetical protein
MYSPFMNSLHGSPSLGLFHTQIVSGSGDPRAPPAALPALAAPDAPLLGAFVFLWAPWLLERCISIWNCFLFPWRYVLCLRNTKLRRRKSRKWPPVSRVSSPQSAAVAVPGLPLRSLAPLPPPLPLPLSAVVYVHRQTTNKNTRQTGNSPSPHPPPPAASLALSLPKLAPPILVSYLNRRLSCQRECGLTHRT